MIRTGQQYLDSIRDNREVYINGERVKDATRDILSYSENGARNAVANKLPRTQQDWWDKRRATDTILETPGGVVTRVADETVGEMWSLFDGQDVLNEVDPRFSANIRRHIQRVAVPWENAHGLVPRVGQRTRSLEMVRGLVGHGLGYGLLATKPANNMSYDGRALATRPLASAAATSRLVLATRSGVPLSPAAHAFVGHYRSFFGGSHAHATT
jgi:hypothetical protein